MKIVRISPSLVRLPIGKSMALPMADRNGSPRASLDVVVVSVHTDSGATGSGFVAAPRVGPASIATIRSELSPLLLGENATAMERLWAKCRLDDAGLRMAYSAIDVACWDLKGKQAGVPLWRLFGGARTAAPCFSGETASSSLSVEDVCALGRAAVGAGCTGVRVGIAGGDPEADSRRVLAVRDALGEDVWFGVSMESRIDYETALPFGRFIEEEIGADWFEDPVQDVSDLIRLGQRIDTPLAFGNGYDRASDFSDAVRAGVRAILRPNLARLGGLTPMLRLIALAHVVGRPVVPVAPSEIGVHLGCGFSHVATIEHASWLHPLFANPLKFDAQGLMPSEAPGLGLDLNPDALERYAVK